MRLFLDTNIFPEFIDRRAQYNEVCLLIDAIHDGHFDACISTGVVAGTGIWVYPSTCPRD